MAITGLANKNISATARAAYYGNLVLSSPITGWSIVPTRTSCIELGGIHFSAVPQGVSSKADLWRIFLYEKYRWDFGDPTSGTFQDGTSKNAEFGPEAGHVFRTAGTYTVTLYVTYGGVETAVATQSITVTSADTYFSGTNTICFSNSTDFTGAPAGSTQVTTTSYDTALGYIASGKRLLFKRGDTFTLGVLNRLGTSAALNNTLIASFGSGALPVISYQAGVTAFDLGYNATIANFSSNNTVADLYLDGYAAGVCVGANTHNYNEHFTLTGCTARKICTLYYGAHSELEVQSGVTRMRYGVVIDCNDSDHTSSLTADPTAAGGAMHIFAGGIGMSVIGNRFKNAGAYSHINRITFPQHICVRHNLYQHNSSFNRLSLKMHSADSWQGYQNDGITPRWNPKTYQGHDFVTTWYTGIRTEFASIGANVFQAITNTQNYAISLGPQDPWSYEEFGAILCAGNYFTGLNNHQCVLVEAANVVVRNNVFNGSQWAAYDRASGGIQISQYMVGTESCHWYKNTYYAPGVPGQKNVAAILEGGTEFANYPLIESNLVYALPKNANNQPYLANLNGEFALPFVYDQQNNVYNPATYPFVANPPTDVMTDFTLLTSGVGADVGEF